MAKRKRADDDRLLFLEEIKRTCIIGIFSDDFLLEKLVLKGGNLIDMVFDISSRASLDIDLSMTGEFADSLDKLKLRLENSLGHAFAEIGLVVFDFSFEEWPEQLTDDLREFWGGYRAEFKLIEREFYAINAGNYEQLRRRSLRVGGGEMRKFSIEISKHEYCVGKERTDFHNYTIYVYSPAMLVSEKLRAICQQMEEYVCVVMKHRALRARDFLDLFLVVTKFSVQSSDSAFRETLRQTFGVKRVRLELLSKLENERDFHRPDFESVKATVKKGAEIKAYDFYFDFVLQFVRGLESFWNE